MLTWLLVVAGEDSQCDGMAQGRGSFHGVGSALGLGQSAPGVVCQPSRQALYMSCKASTVEGVKTRFLFSWDSGQSKALSCSISSDRSQQQSWLSHPVLS